MTPPRLRVELDADFFLIRSPIHSMRQWAGMLHVDAERDLPLDALEYEARWEAVRRLLREHADAPVLNEAIYVSSRDLHAQVQKYLTGPGSPEVDEGIELALMKYFTRSATRSTPFGLLAGVALGVLASNGETDLRLGPCSNHRRHVRLDARVALEVAAVVASSAADRKAHSYRMNTSLYRLGSRVRFYETRGHVYGGPGRVVTLNRTEALDAVLRRSRHGVPWNDLVEAVLECAPDVDRGDIDEFLFELIDGQVLIPDVYPSVIGEEMLHSLLGRLPRNGAADSAIAALESLRHTISELNQMALGGGRSSYERSAKATLDLLPELASRLGAATEGGVGGEEEETELDGVGSKSGARARRQNLFQVDLALELPGARLCRHELLPILDAVEALFRIHTADTGNPLADFARQFVQRYEECEVPLAEALDPDVGIRYGVQARLQAEPSPLLQLPEPADGRPGVGQLLVDPWRLELLARALANGDERIELRPEAIRARFPIPSAPPPESFSALVSIQSKANGTGSRSRRFILSQVSRAPAPMLAGRFAHVLGSALTSKLVVLGREEQERAGVRLATVDYLPPSRLGNVCQAPRFRDATICYLAPTSTQGPAPILVDDLLVSVRHGQVVLRDRTTGDQVLPRLDSALNYSHATSPSIFQFLGALQFSGQAPVGGWYWGGLDQVPDLPRVEIGGVVVSPRTWRIDRGELQALWSTKGEGASVSNHGRFNLIQEWQRKRRMPRFIGIGNMADFMAVDFENPLSVAILIRELRRGGVARELFCDEYEWIVDGEAGAHAHEIMLPLRTVSEVTRERPNVFKRSTSEPPRQLRRINSECLYVKFYGGEAWLDRLLRQDLGNVLVDAEIHQARWFFVRYSDPHPHLRVRVFASTECLVHHVLPRIEELAVAAQSESRQSVVIDAYEPEELRYGGPAASVLCHAIFAVDSETSLQLMRVHAPFGPPITGASVSGGGEGRWFLAICSAWGFLADLGMSDSERTEFMASYSHHMGNEFKLARVHFQAVNRLYGGIRLRLDEMESQRAEEKTPWDVLLPLFRRRRERLAPLVTALREIAAKGELESSLNSVLASLFHMHMNRLFVTRQRYQEMWATQVLGRWARQRVHRRPSSVEGR